MYPCIVCTGTALTPIVYVYNKTKPKLLRITYSCCNVGDETRSRYPNSTKRGSHNDDASSRIIPETSCTRES